jgi:hypothetical protein
MGIIVSGEHQPMSRVVPVLTIFPFDFVQVLYLKEVDTMLALVCITRSENFRKKSLINYNIDCLKKALRALVLSTPEAGH